MYGVKTKKPKTKAKFVVLPSKYNALLDDYWKLFETNGELARALDIDALALIAENKRLKVIERQFATVIEKWGKLDNWWRQVKKFIKTPSNYVSRGCQEYDEHIKYYLEKEIKRLETGGPPTW